MAPLAIPLMLAGTAMSAYGQIQQGQAAEAEAKSQQNMANYNAKVAERDATAVEQKTRIEQIRQAKESERRLSTLNMNMGKAGVVSTSGTPLLLQATQSAEDELDNLMIGYEGAQEASRFRSQAGMYRAEGSMARERGRNAKTASYIGAGATLLKGFGDMGAFTPDSTSRDKMLAKKHGIAYKPF